MYSLQICSLVLTFFGSNCCRRSAGAFEDACTVSNTIANIDTLPSDGLLNHKTCHVRKSQFPRIVSEPITYSLPLRTVFSTRDHGCTNCTVINSHLRQTSNREDTQTILPKLRRHSRPNGTRPSDNRGLRNMRTRPTYLPFKG